MGDFERFLFFAPLAVSVEHMECEIKLEAPPTPERIAAAEAEMGKGLLEDSEEVKKRKRKPYRPGKCSSLWPGTKEPVFPTQIIF